ncbi:hypothetical protein V6N13_098951 [Hibiscus sabdariffa]
MTLHIFVYLAAFFPCACEFELREEPKDTYDYLGKTTYGAPSHAPIEIDYPILASFTIIGFWILWNILPWRTPTSSGSLPCRFVPGYIYMVYSLLDKMKYLFFRNEEGETVVTTTSSMEVAVEETTHSLFGHIVTKATIDEDALIRIFDRYGSMKRL